MSQQNEKTMRLSNEEHTMIANARDEYQRRTGRFIALGTFATMLALGASATWQQLDMKMRKGRHKR